MTSIIRVGQSKFVTVQIDEDSNERIMNCIQTLAELETQPAVHEIFLEDTKSAFSKMLGAQEVNPTPCHLGYLLTPEYAYHRNVQLRRSRRKPPRLLLSRLTTSCHSVSSQRRPQTMRSMYVVVHLAFSGSC